MEAAQTSTGSYQPAPTTAAGSGPAGASQVPQYTNAQLLEKVVYTASLVSDFRAIDPLMDKVRGVTSMAGSAANFTNDQRQTLMSVQEQLERHLLQNERVRFFTADSLHVQIEQHLKGASSYRHSKQLLLGIIGLTIASIVVVPFVPGAPSEPLKLVPLTGSVAMSILHIGAALLFLTALGSFKTSLRTAFRIMCAGIIILGLALLEQPFIQILGIRDVPVMSIVVPTSLLLTAVLTYEGIRRYARIIDVQGWMMSRKPVVIAALTLAVVAWLVPHPLVDQPEMVFNASAILQGWIVIFPILAVFILHKAERHLAEVYRPPTRALKLATAAVMLVTLYAYGIRLTLGPYLEGVLGIIAFGLLILMGSLLLRAGYAFNKISRY